MLAIRDVVTVSTSSGSGVGSDVADHDVRVAAFDVEVRVGVVFCNPPHAVPLVPGGGPAKMVLEEADDPRGFLGRGQDRHTFLIC